MVAAGWWPPPWAPPPRRRSPGMAGGGSAGRVLARAGKGARAVGLAGTRVGAARAGTRGESVCSWGRSRARLDAGARGGRGVMGWAWECGHVWGCTRVNAEGLMGARAGVQGGGRGVRFGDTRVRLWEHAEAWVSPVRPAHSTPRRSGRPLGPEEALGLLEASVVHREGTGGYRGCWGGGSGEATS